MRFIIRLFEKHARKMRNIVARGVVSLVDDGPMLQTNQIKLLDGELIEGAERAQQYGFTSHPQTEAECFVVFAGAGREHPLVLSVDDRRYRVKSNRPGEVVIYTDEGDRIALKRDNTIEVTTKHFIVRAEEDVTIETKVFRLTAETSISEETDVFSLKAETSIGQETDVFTLKAQKSAGIETDTLNLKAETDLNERSKKVSVKAEEISSQADASISLASPKIGLHTNALDMSDQQGGAMSAMLQGSLTATDDLAANSGAVSLRRHVHSGVEPGDGATGTPSGG